MLIKDEPSLLVSENTVGFKSIVLGLDSVWNISKEQNLEIAFQDKVREGQMKIIRISARADGGPRSPSAHA